MTESTDEPISQQFREIIRYAALAPSGHNTQPWKFKIDHGFIAVFADLARRLPIVDPDDHELYISVGCAVENLVVAAGHFGLDAEVEYFPPSEGECFLVRLKKADQRPDSTLFEAIPERQSNRSKYDGRTINSGDLERLREAAERPGVRFMLFTTPEEIDPLIEFVKEGNLKQFSDKAFVEELVSWLRFSRKDVEKNMDGLTSAAMGLPWIPRWMGKTIMKLFVTPGSQAKQFEKLIRGSSALMLFAAERDERSNWIDVGRAFERVALRATSLGISQAHMNMPCEVPETREGLRGHLKLADAQPLLLLRIGYADPRPRSPRRPIEEVLV